MTVISDDYTLFHSIAQGGMSLGFANTPSNQTTGLVLKNYYFNNNKS